MQRWTAFGVVIVIMNIRGVVTKTQDPSGISEFWTDDYKVFDQIYGKTSDKEIYGATLPPNLSFSFDDATKFLNQASDKKERYIDSDSNTDNSNLDVEQIDPYGYGKRYNNLLTKQAIKEFTLTTKKPSKKTPLKFISTNFKPITKENDPETYKYLQHLELSQKKKSEYSKSTNGGFKPYLNYAGPNPEDTEAYKSIQDILDAHVANKGIQNDNTNDQVKYLTYGGTSEKKGKNGSRSNKKPVVRPPPYKNYNSRCPYGRCRKRATKTYRVGIGPRPYVRRIKHKIISY